MRDILAVNNAGGCDTPADKQSTAEATIFTLHQQSASHIKLWCLAFTDMDKSICTQANSLIVNCLFEMTGNDRGRSVMSPNF